jgi:hypothetical protein
MSQMILLSMPMTTQNAKKSCFISFQQKKKNSTPRSMKTQKRKTITLKTKQRKNTTLIDRSAAGTWCQRSRSGRLKTRENPFASWIMPSPV